MMRFFYYFVGEAVDAFAAPVDFFAFFFLDFVWVVPDLPVLVDGAAAVAAGAGDADAGGVVP